MDLPDHIRRGQGEEVVVASQRPGVVGEPVAPIVFFLQAERLEHRPHGPVENQDPRGDGVPETVDAGVARFGQRLPPDARSPGRSRCAPGRAL